MSYFGSALSDALTALGWKQLDLAAKCDIPASQINRYIRGTTKQIPLDSAARVIGVLPPAQHPPLLVAYLRDCVPKGYDQLVEIYAAAGDRAQESPPSQFLLPTIDKELDRILRIYADLAMRHEEVRVMLKSFLTAMRVWPAAGEPPQA